MSDVIDGFFAAAAFGVAGLSDWVARGGASLLGASSVLSAAGPGFVWFRRLLSCLL